MTIIELNKRFYAIPTEWNELSRKQLLAVMKVLCREMEVNAAMLCLLRILAGMGWFRFLRVPMQEKAEFLYLCQFLVNKNELTKNILTKFGKFYGPDDDFNNITGAEYVFSEDAYFKYKQFSDERDLDALVAILYRPAKKNYNHAMNPDGDVRVEFNENICAYHAKKTVRRWPFYVKMAVLTWYEACRQQLIDSNPDVFTGGSGEPAKYGLISVMRTIAEGGIHGDFEKVQKMFVKMWMMELNEKVEEARRIEKETK